MKTINFIRCDSGITRVCVYKQLSFRDIHRNTDILMCEMMSDLLYYNPGKGKTKLKGFLKAGGCR